MAAKPARTARADGWTDGRTHGQDPAGGLDGGLAGGRRTCSSVTFSDDLSPKSEIKD
jgi:hypothetical protein